MSALKELYKEINQCQDCNLYKTRTKVVPGDGPEDSELLFIGEAPGWNEDQQGLPFVGQAGSFLDHLLSLINLNRNQVYIANVIKCRPPNNRDPLPTEMLACKKWLDRQIDIINPKIIVTLGRYSLARYFPKESIGKMHGRAQKRDGVIFYPMYHPAAALHQFSLRKTIEADMIRIPALLKGSEEIVSSAENVQQLNLL
jgi:DNA polymerase